MDRPSVLIICSDNRAGISRLPRALYVAGFDVHIIAPIKSVIRFSRYVGMYWEFPAKPGYEDVVAVVRHAIASTRPILIIGGNERVVSFMQGSRAQLQEFARLYNPKAVVSGSPSSMTELIMAKSALIARAQEMGIPTPETIGSCSVREAMDFSARYQHSVALKLDGLVGGQGVELLDSEPEIRARLAEFADQNGMLPPKLSIQEKLRGVNSTHTFVALDGEWLEGYTFEILENHPAPKGPSTVIRFIDSIEAERYAQKIARHSQFTGIGGIDLILNPGTGQPRLLEFNPRPVPTSHLGALIDRDLATALYSALMRGGYTRAAERKFTRSISLFPKELIRNGDSEYFDTTYHDVPWDDVNLVEALLGMVPGQNRSSMYAPPPPIDVETEESVAG